MKKILLLFLLPVTVLAQSLKEQLDTAPSLRKNAHGKTSVNTFDPVLKPFYHGVASGDPSPTSLVIWTRVTPDTGFTGSLNGSWAVATDTAMTNVVASGNYITDNTKDYTVKENVTGLQAGTTYYYKFKQGSAHSLIGRGKTLPTNASHLRYAVVSCNNYEAGYFNGFARIAERNDIDAVIHLGDYIYEYEAGQYGDTTINRFHDSTETIDLQEYRNRYSLYRLDPDLRRAHQQHTFINIWDDHETANDAYQGGAENHDPATEGPWNTRKNNAYQAFHEWIPIEDRATPVIYRSFNFGNLAELVMLDTRIEGREQQINDVTNPALYNPNRTMLGQSQRDWFLNALDNSTAQWKIVGNQVIFAQLQVGFAAQAPQTPQDVESIFLDIWDGYPAERQRIITHLDTAGIDNVVFVTGDFHSSFAFDIADTVVNEALLYAPVPNYNPATGAGSRAVEFTTPSITSANFDENVGSLAATAIEAQINAPLPGIGNNPNPHMKFVDLDRHGYIILDVRPDSVTANWYYVDKINATSSNESFGKAWGVNDTENHLRVASESPEKTTKDIPAPLLPPNGIGLTEEKLAVFSVYPNPVKDELTIQLGTQNPGDVSIKLVSLDGKNTYPAFQTNMPAGIFDVKLNLADLPQGIYLLHLSSGETAKTFKVVKQ